MPLIGVRLSIHRAFYRRFVTDHGSNCLSTSANSGCDIESSCLVVSPSLQLSSGGVAERADKSVIHPVRFVQHILASITTQYICMYK